VEFSLLALRAGQLMVEIFKETLLNLLIDPSVE
jgi:hypothetical protein